MPDLRNNLLAVLYPSCVEHIRTVIKGNQLRVERNGELLFTGTINTQNVGYLDGYAVPDMPISAGALLAKPISTLPLDASLWHRCHSMPRSGTVVLVFCTMMLFSS